MTTVYQVAPRSTEHSVLGGAALCLFQPASGKVVARDNVTRILDPGAVHGMNGSWK